MKIIEANVDDKGGVESFEAIKENIYESINPLKLGIGIRKVQPCGKGRVLISCDSNKSGQILRSEVKKVLNEKYQMRYQVQEKAVPWKPRIMVMGLNKNVDKVDDEQLIDDIIKHNNLDVNNEKVYVKKIVSFPDSRYCNQIKMVLEVDAETRKRLVRCGVMKLNWMTGRVTDYVFVRRCYKCGGYGHNQKDCTNDVHCPECAGNHNLKECRAQDKDVKCINCLLVNKKLGLNLDIYHSSRSFSCKGSFTTT